jgi:hypothetical protein
MFLKAINLLEKSSPIHVLSMLRLQYGLTLEKLGEFESAQSILVDLGDPILWSVSGLFVIFYLNRTQQSYDFSFLFFSCFGHINCYFRI